jgi:hypothetical protein
VSRRPPLRRRTPDDRLAVAMAALRADYRAARPASDLLARIRSSLRPQLRAAARRSARRIAASLLAGLLGGWILGRLPPPAATPVLANGSVAPRARSGPVPRDAATVRLRRLIATADALPCPSPATVATWRSAQDDPDADVRAAAATLLRAAGQPVPCPEEAP